MEDLQKRLRESNDPEILKALDEGWEPPPLEDAISWWETTVADDPYDHIADILALAVEHAPPGVILDEVFGFFRCSATEFLGEESEEDLTELGWNSKVAESKAQRQFRRDMSKADRDIRFYEGRFHYQGWATEAEDFNDIQKIIRATSVMLQWDQLGKVGYIVYLQ